MELDNNEWKVLNKLLDTWKQEGKLSAEEAEKLGKSFELRQASQQIAKYFFMIALSCTLLAFGAIFIVERLLERIKQFFSLSNMVIALMMGGLAIAWFIYVGRQAHRFKSLSYEIYMVLGGLASLACMVYICKDIGFGPSYTLFLAFSAMLLFACSLLFKSQALWIGALAAVMGFYAAWTYHLSSDNLFMGMNYPVRFTVFGILITGLSLFQRLIRQLQFTQQVTYTIGLVIFFTGLWGVSIFGNYNHFGEWQLVRQSSIMVWAFVFGFAALAALFLGIRYKDETARDLGLLFLLVNFYTRYFEYFWDTMNKGIFFLILAVSFWLVGRWIERSRKKIVTPSE